VHTHKMDQHNSFLHTVSQTNVKKRPCFSIFCLQQCGILQHAVQKIWFLCI